MARKITALKKPVIRTVVVEGVTLVVTLSDRSISARVKRRRQTYAHALSGLFLAAIRQGKARDAAPLPQEEIDLRIPREA